MKSKNFLFPERIVLESLSRGPKGVDFLSEDSGITKQHLETILTRLQNQNLILFKDNQFSLNREAYDNLEEKSICERKREAEEVLKIMLGQVLLSKDKKEDFVLKKVWMTAEEEIYFNSMLQKLNDFVHQLSTRRSNNKNMTSKQKMIFWGKSTYLDLVNSFLTRN